MKRKILNFSRRYQSALRTHLTQTQPGSLELARGLGSDALSAGLQTLDLAKLHEQTLVKDVLPGCARNKRTSIIRQAGAFFALAITPIAKTQSRAQQATAHLKKFIETLSQRTVELAASNLELNLEITQRKAVEEALKKSERHYSQLLVQSDRLQEQLRRLSRQILSAQEEERKKISRELHDVIAQTLTGINIRLATLKKEASINTKGLNRNIARTQRQVEKSVHIVHRFARELRPAVLDDLGLLPALHAFMKLFTERTGVRTNLTTFAEIEMLDSNRRTVLFRVAQEALTNVGRHAEATSVEVTIQKQANIISMKIQDDGKSFDVEQAFRARRRRRLGLLGMRERLEMVNGNLNIDSSVGKGTLIEARIPLVKPRGKKETVLVDAVEILATNGS